MTRVISPNFSRLDRKTRNLVQRMARFDLADRLELIENTFGRIAFRSGFTLADQVLTHALVSNKTRFETVLLAGGTRSGANHESVQNITRDLYDLKFKDGLSNDIELVLATDHPGKGEFIERDSKGTTLLVNPLADWSNEKLVEYVLAHEVPVNPEDMPGFSSKVA
ncbi:MAG: hypothetical protein AAGA76_06110 [Pseudomonadota bacterium]